LEEKVIPLPTAGHSCLLTALRRKGICVKRSIMWTLIYLFSGSFPGYPIFPGVLHVEAMAQTLGLLVKTPGLPLLARIEQAKFMQPIFPGDNITIKAKLENEKAGFYFGSGQIFKGDTLVSEAKIVFKVAVE